jgi:enoyl-[acyl-carrier-protein] reductase (NADH)
VTLLEPENVASAAAFLVSDEAKHITGVQFPVDAGFSVA